MSHSTRQAEQQNQKPSGMTFNKLFATATSDAAHPNGREPFDYQRRLAEDSTFQSRLIETPFRFGNR